MFDNGWTLGFLFLIFAISGTVLGYNVAKPSEKDLQIQEQRIVLLEERKNQILLLEARNNQLTSDLEAMISKCMAVNLEKSYFAGIKEQ
jgi:hypothetical protein